MTTTEATELPPDVMSDLLERNARVRELVGRRVDVLDLEVAVAEARLVCALLRGHGEGSA